MSRHHGDNHRELTPQDLFGQMAERCRALGLVTWISAPDATTLESGDADAGAWGCDEIVGRVATAASELRAEGVGAEPRVVCIDGGLRVIMLPSERVRRDGLILCAGAPAPGWKSGWLSSVAPDIADACPVMGDEELARFVGMLAWMRKDLDHARRDAEAIREFSGELGEAYEELGLLYRLGRSMNKIGRPAHFVDMACEELGATLPFGWIGASFAKTDRVVGDLAGRTFPSVGGDAAERVRALAPNLLPKLDSDRWTLLGSDGAARPAPGDPGVLAHPIVRDGQVIGVLMAGEKGGQDREISSFETQLLDAASDYMGVFVENSSLYSEQRQLFFGTIEALTAAIDAKDRYTRGHSERVAYLGHQLALAVGVPDDEAERMRISGILHDVGKIGVPEAVLTKPGRLTKEEFELVKLHPTIGARILEGVPQLRDALPGVMHHHERWDGRGYPDGLAGEGIPLVARILGVADAFDAMSSTRSYRSSMPREKVLEEMSRCSGTQFAPDLVGPFLELDLSGYDDLVRIHSAMPEPAFRPGDADGRAAA